MVDLAVLSGRQSKILTFIRDFTLRHLCPPTIRGRIELRGQPTQVEWMRLRGVCGLYGWTLLANDTNFGVRSAVASVLT